jgi:hypothetical protein
MPLMVKTAIEPLTATAAIDGKPVATGAAVALPSADTLRSSPANGSVK